MFPYALSGVILGLAGATVAPAILFWLVGTVGLSVSEGVFTFKKLLDAATGALAFSPAVIIVAGGHALFLGLPAFLLFQAFGKLSWRTAVAGGFLIGALPVSMISAPGSYTAWSSAAGTALVFGAFGVCGGAAFWFLWKRFGAQPSSSD